jgi:FKBP-type peptidyl-prolyl cis-trans isomerase
MRRFNRSLCLLIPAAICMALIAADAPTSQPTKRTTQSGLTIISVQPSNGAQAGDKVSVLYTGKLADGTVFDASSQHPDPQTGQVAPIDFTLGAGNVIKGWDEGLVGMNIGEKRTLIIPPNLGYGAQGAGDGKIPANATLTFDVELVGISRPSK